VTSFDITTTAGFVCGTDVVFNLAVSSANGSSNIPITLPSCAATTCSPAASRRATCRGSAA
jgi:hypothetical protein